MVLKLILDDVGDFGQFNDLCVVSFEYKLGIYGSLICVMFFEGVIGWIVGEEYKGMVVMFIMMNCVWFGVGIQGVV